MKLNKKQKRTATIASMAALLAVVLGMGGQTFAKYISTQETAAQATVAKWGFVITSTVDDKNPFAEEYGAKVVSEEASNASVVRNVVAPGTKGGVTIKVDGNAEVLAKLSFVASFTEPTLTVSKENRYSDNTGTALTEDYVYTPIAWSLTITGTKTTTNGTETESIASKTKLADIQSFFATPNIANFAANTSVDYGFVLAWSWNFNNTDVAFYEKVDDEYVAVTENDLDTYLGISADGKALPAGYVATTGISVSVTTTIEQVQA